MNGSSKRRRRRRQGGGERKTVQTCTFSSHFYFTINDDEKFKILTNKLIDHTH